MKRVIREMERVEADVKKDLKQTIAEVVALTEKFRYLGKSFTFEDAGVDADINQLLLQLSDQIQADIDVHVLFAIQEAEAEDDSSDIYAYIGRADEHGIDAQDRIDTHVSRLKYLMEGFIAICFAQKIYRGRMEHQMLLHVLSPYGDDFFKTARKDKEYLATFIKDGDLNSRSGYSNNIVKAISVVGSTMVAESFHYGRVAGYRKAGAIGYGVKRNSSYDCPDCDEVCAIVHPLTEIVVPVHPNCCCSTFPVFTDDI